MCFVWQHGIIVLTRKETWQIFFRISITSKENEELFTSSYNGITASVSLVSSTLVDFPIGCGTCKNQKRRW